MEVRVLRPLAMCRARELCDAVAAAATLLPNEAIGVSGVDDEDVYVSDDDQAPCGNGDASNRRTHVMLAGPS